MKIAMFLSACVFAPSYAYADHWDQIEQFFSPPKELRTALGNYRSPLRFAAADRPFAPRAIGHDDEPKSLRNGTI